MLDFAGVIEGFYGPPWSWDDRIEVCRFLAARGANTYVYAPKSDPLHRDQWRTPYERDALEGFERLIEESGLSIGFAVSPGLSMTLNDTDDRQRLLAKFGQVLGLGARMAFLALDDIETTPESGRSHGELCAWLADAIAPIPLVFVPTDYTSTAPNAYLDALATTCPETVAIGWTGPTVVADRITAADARGRADALGARPWLWDNFPVNDAVMSDRLFMGPLRGREPALQSELCGYLANPMVQPRASQLPLASAMAFCRGDDPIAEWHDAATTLGWTDFARAMDELHLAALADNDDVSNYLRAVVSCEVPGIEHEVGPWLDQARREAETAIALIEALDANDMMQTLGAVMRWIRIPDPAVSVFGPRRSLRPVIAHDDQLGFVTRSRALDINRNAIDRLFEARMNA